jgi:hypothetical protein
MKPFIYSCIASVCLLASSCSSESTNEPNIGNGTVSFSVKSEALFSSATRATRAVNESDYEEVNNYYVEIIDRSGNIVTGPTLYKDLANTINLSNGNYTIKAYYGEEATASQQKFYVVGSKNFTVNADDQAIELICKPTCGKFIVDFSNESMDKYFSDYYVTFETEALAAEGSTITWGKTTIDPYYMKLNASGETVKAVVHYTVKQEDGTAGQSDSMELTNDMTPAQQWIMHIAPKDGSGSLTVTIVINDETNDRVIPIVVPSDWIYGSGNVND